MAGNTSSRSGTSTCTRAGGGDSRLEAVDADVEAAVDDGLVEFGGETAGEDEDMAEKNEVELAKPSPLP